MKNGRYSSLEIRMKRRKLGLTQAEFWQPIGVSVRAGRRYENGSVSRDIKVQLLIGARYYGRPIRPHKPEKRK